MIVCICRGASDRDIQSAIDGGAKCLTQLEDCGVGGDCHGCEGALRDMLSSCSGDTNACKSCCTAEQKTA